MAILRCNKCEHIREVGIDYVGKSVKCPECRNHVVIHDTITFANALINRNMAQTAELQKLRNQSDVEGLNNKADGDSLFDGIDIKNTNIFAQEKNVSPIVDWFDKRNISLQIDPSAVDTTGFFDEIASLLGKNFEVLSQVTNQIKYIQSKGYKNVKIDLSKKSGDEAKQIKSFCSAMHDYSFVTKYHFQKKENCIHISLQMAPKIKNFFNGIWMEWFALMEILDFFKEKEIDAVCGRSLEVSFSGGTCNELDLFFLINKETPIYVECKSGEFRQEIEKYLSLKKRLKIDKDQFVLCVFGLDKEKAQGMTAMYGLTFVNENTLIDHIKTLV